MRKQLSKITDGTEKIKKKQKTKKKGEKIEKRESTQMCGNPAGNQDSAIDRSDRMTTTTVRGRAYKDGERLAAAWTDKNKWAFGSY